MTRHDLTGAVLRGEEGGFPGQAVRDGGRKGQGRAGGGVPPVPAADPQRRRRAQRLPGGDAGKLRMFMPRGVKKTTGPGEGVSLLLVH